MKTKESNVNLIKIVKILSDGRFHDGTAIGSALGMTRAAVWKAIKKLEAHGVDIESVKGKGYALKESLVLLDANNIKSRLPQQDFNIVVLEEVGSTNDYLKNIKQSSKPTICIAEKQNKGKGRLQRTWYSPFAKNVYLSCLYSFHKDMSELAGLSLVEGLVIAKTLNGFGAKESFLVKWPNDVLYANKKIAGTLIEIQAESHGVAQAVIGIGVNINMLQAGSEINQAWDSLRHIAGAYIDRNQFCATLIENLLAYLERFAKQGLSAFTKEWEKADYLVNKPVVIKQVGHEIKGVAKGINEQGLVQLQLPNGSMRVFSSGDASVASIG